MRRGNGKQHVMPWFGLLLFACLVAVCPVSAARVERLACPAQFVTALAFDSTGAVWVGTEDQGVFRLSHKMDAWKAYTTKDGLPEDQAESLVFTAQGDLIAGLQCGGVAIARLNKNPSPSPWEHMLAPWYSDKSQFNPYTLQPEGEGLPSNLINDVLVAKDGTLWVATVAGVAWCAPRTGTWRFLRGKDYAARVKGVYGGPPNRWRAPSQGVDERLLPEDYVTCLAEGADGCIWMGFREKGCAAFNPKTLICNEWVKPDSKSSRGDTLEDGYVKRLLPLPDGRILAGGYGGGLSLIAPLAVMNNVRSSLQPPPAVPTGMAFPEPAAPPTDEQMLSLTQQLNALHVDPFKEKTGAYLGED